MRSDQELRLQVVPSSELSIRQQLAVRNLCNRAYEENLDALFDTFNGTHILGFVDKALVSHAMWITRWLQIGDSPLLLRTAYVELVATEADFRNRGFATAVMTHLASQLSDFDIAALSPFSTTYYARIGWEKWQGPLLIRKDAELLPTPEDEEVMILRLPRTPEVELTDTLSVEWRDGDVW